MTRNLKALGLAVAAVLAISAVWAAGAWGVSPARLTTQTSPVTFTGTGAGGFNLNGRLITCHHVSDHATANHGDTTLTVTTQYSNCTSSIGPATITMNGCNFVWHLTADPVHTFTAVKDITCPVGQVMEIHVYSNHTNHTNNTSLCTYHIGTQSGFTSTDLTNMPAGTKPQNWVRGHIKYEKIKFKRTSGSTLICGPEVGETGTYEGEAEFEGENSEGEASGITISTDEI